MYYYKKRLFNPFITGIILGLIVNNIPLALVTTGLTMMLWGWKEGANYITGTTILLVIATGNINFEIIYIFILSLIWILDNILKDNKARSIIFTVASSLSILLFPLWKYLLGLVPAQLLNEFNIAGELLLLAGILLNLQRGLKKEKGRTKYLLFTFLAGISITANIVVIPCLFAGLILDIYRDKKEFQTLEKDRAYYLFLTVISLIFIYHFIPFTIFMGTIFVMLVVYIYLRQDKAVLIETVYLTLLTGLIAGKIGLLN